MEIFVDIKKKLPGFQLNVKLASEKDIIGILGASGSGKSMLLRCISGLVNPDEGKIIVNGKTFFDSQSKINLMPRERKVGFLFQNYALFPHLTIWENISFGLDRLSKADKDRRVTELMERFHLKDMERRYPSQISGGQQQRVALARAVAIEPEILLLDEPFSALDDHLRNHMIKEMSESLKAFQGNTLFVTHNMEEAYHLCDRIAVLNAGSVEAFDLKEQLFQSPASLETAKITGCKNISEAIKKSEYSVEIPAWGIQANTGIKIEAERGFAGIRANNIKLADNGTGENCFAAWIADKSETPFRTTLYLKIGAAPENSEDFHIEWEISQEQMNGITSLSQPIYIRLEPKHLFFVYK